MKQRLMVLLITLAMLSTLLTTAVMAADINTGMSDVIRTAYLNELQANQYYIQGCTGKGRISADEKYVSFTDLTDDGIPEMIYLYLDDTSDKGYFRIVSYQNGNLIVLKDTEGNDLWAFGSVNGDAADLFTVKNDNHLYVKAGTNTGTSVYDVITEYEISGNTLCFLDSYRIDSRFGMSDYYTSKQGFTVADMVLPQFDRIVEDVDQIPFGSLYFFAYDHDVIQLDDESAMMTYDEAVGYLSAGIEDFNNEAANETETINGILGTVYHSENNYLLLMYAPDVNSGYYAAIPEGTDLIIESVEGSWGYTTYGEFSGWVQLRYIKINNDYASQLPSYGYGAPYIARVSGTGSEGLELRTAPSADYATFGAVPEGTEVTVEALENSWAYTSYNGHYGWMHTYYLDYVRNIPQEQMMQQQTSWDGITTGTMTDQNTKIATLLKLMVGDMGINIRDYDPANISNQKKLLSQLVGQSGCTCYEEFVPSTINIDYILNYNGYTRCCESDDLLWTAENVFNVDPVVYQEFVSEITSPVILDSDYPLVPGIRYDSGYFYSGIFGWGECEVTIADMDIQQTDNLYDITWSYYNTRYVELYGIDGVVKNMHTVLEQREYEGEKYFSVLLMEQTNINSDQQSVYSMQLALNQAGYYCGEPDGFVGEMTKAAMNKYQYDHGLEITDTITVELLESLGFMR